jgi:hypothetical protein
VFVRKGELPQYSSVPAQFLGISGISKFFQPLVVPMLLYELFLAALRGFHRVILLLQ